MAEDRNGFWLLAAGALVFAAGFLLATEWLNLDDAQGGLEPPVLLALCTILFGLPYAARELLGRKTNWLLIAFLLILIPVFQYAAANVFVYVSSQTAEAAARMAESAAQAADPTEMAEAAPPGATTSAMFIGLAAGFAGAIGPLLALALLPWLRAPGADPRLFAAAALALAWVAAMGVRLTNVESAYDLVVTVFLPWQILLACFLSRLIKASPPKDAAAP